jgi:CHAT domain-containing protein
MELKAELAVLSACQTGLGKLIRGEGMIGLSRSFMYAGVPSVVVSLWSVSDQSTNILMERFYTNLIEKGVSLAEALYLARISMIKDEQFAHPFYWAPFVLTGDWQ